MGVTMDAGDVAMVNWHEAPCSDQVQTVIDLLRDAVDAGDAGVVAPAIFLLERVQARVRGLERLAYGR